MSARSKVLSAGVWPGEWWWSLAEVEQLAWAGALAAAIVAAVSVPLLRHFAASRAKRAESARQARRLAVNLVPPLEMACDSLHRIRGALADPPRTEVPEDRLAQGQVRGLPEIRLHMDKTPHLGHPIATRLGRFLVVAEDFNRQLADGEFTASPETVDTALRELAALQMAINLIAFDVKPRDAFTQ